MTPATNPVIPGFHPDPTICRVGVDFFLATSSFTYFPGVPLFRSGNLVDWELIGHALDRTSQLDLSHASWSSYGNFAPTLRHHDGRFWMITTVAAGGRLHNFFVTADDPAGPWSDPVTVDVLGIDPDIAWDDEGNCWVHFSGAGGIQRCRIDDVTGEVLDEPETTWSGAGLQAPEAPHLFRRDDQWYLLIAEGGTERGHAVSIARGPTPWGPWEPHPGNPVLSHRSTDSPIQNTGHADLVQGPDGRWWLVALGVRPRGVTPKFHVLGRETFLAPVTWQDGWPVVEPLQETLPLERGTADLFAVVDDFVDPGLALEWVAVRRPADEFSDTTRRPGWLTIDAGANGLDSRTPAMVARRQQHHTCVARTLVSTDDDTEAGLVVYMDDTAHYAVAVVGDRVIARATIGPLSSVVGEAPRPGAEVVLFAETTTDDERAPDTVHLGIETADGERTVLASLDGRYLSTEVVGGFIGRTIGMYAVDGTAGFDWFEYRET